MRGQWLCLLRTHPPRRRTQVVGQAGSLPVANARLAHVGRPVADSEICRSLASEASSFLRGSFQAHRRRLVLVETAGGVASPGPSGTLQVQLRHCRCAPHPADTAPGAPREPPGSPPPPLPPVAVRPAAPAAPAGTAGGRRPPGWHLCHTFLARQLAAARLRCAPSGADGGPGAGQRRRAGPSPGRALRRAAVPAVPCPGRRQRGRRGRLASGPRAAWVAGGKRPGV